MCDFAVGLSRQLNGSVIPSERKFYLEPASLMDKGWFFFGYTDFKLFKLSILNILVHIYFRLTYLKILSEIVSLAFKQVLIT